MPQPNQAPIPTPEAPNQVEKELETFEKENEGLEVIERASGAEFDSEKSKIETSKELRQKIGEKPEIGFQRKEELLKTDTEARIEQIVENFVKAARIANFDDDRVQKIIEKSRMYIAKGYPKIADEVHDRILEERERGMH